VGAWGAALKPYSITVKIGPKVFALNYLAVAFSLTATLFWAFSACCVSGKSKNKNQVPSIVVEKGGATSNIMPAGFGKRGYQQIGDEERLLHEQGTALRDIETQDTSYSGGGSGPFKGREAAYEPFRHQGGKAEE
jgi:hypothetical protein